MREGRDYSARRRGAFLIEVIEHHDTCSFIHAIVLENQILKGFSIYLKARPVRGRRAPFITFQARFHLNNSPLVTFPFISSHVVRPTRYASRKP